MTIDKEWEREPNELFWTDEYSEYDCAILRHVTFGTLCGYVRIPEDNIFYDVSYTTEIYESQEMKSLKLNDNTFLIQNMARSILVECIFDVHGGLTFSDFTNFKKDGLSKGFWYGFDCSQFWDYMPYYPTKVNHELAYRNIEYVKDQCTNLAKQLFDINTQQVLT